MGTVQSEWAKIKYSKINNKSGDDVMMTSSPDLLLIFEYLIFAHSLCTVYWICCTRFSTALYCRSSPVRSPNFGRNLLAEGKRNRIFSSLLFYLIYTQE